MEGIKEHLLHMAAGAIFWVGMGEMTQAGSSRNPIIHISSGGHLLVQNEDKRNQT